MNRAFTIIELVLVIVIISILAAVAIPKLKATRDDAITASLSTQVKAATKEVISYYTSQGGDVNFSELPDTSQVVLNELIHYGWVKIKDDNTAVVYSDRENKIVCLKYITDGKDIKLEYNNSNKTPLCEDIKRLVKESNYSVSGSKVVF
jgi:prepilin-type N-terminal cleavage/methylation domain-containing protein